MLTAELKVNGEVIGHFEARNLIAKDGVSGKTLYDCIIRWQHAAHESRGFAQIVEHDPDDGPWRLVERALHKHYRPEED